MICWFCKYPLALASLRAPEANQHEHRKQWACVHCGAKFECVERLVTGPTITAERLKRICNIPR
ncbi:MAG: hypothetical protein ACRD5W_11605 [Candidatus Acidiferrales bacterium]